MLFITKKKEAVTVGSNIIYLAPGDESNE